MKILIFIFALIGIVGCGPKAKNDWLMNPPTKYEMVQEDPASVQGSILPEVEILFVIDNSTSMDKHITNLSNNIDQFVNSLSKNMPFPFHLAVTTVHDHRNLGDESPRKVGELVLVDDKSFISSADENLNEKLRRTLKVGTLSPADGGPEVEEPFSPVAALYGIGSHTVDPLIQKRQNEFFMGNHSYKVVFFITDASDNSLLSATELYLGLLARANGEADRVMGFGALASAGRGCPQDPGMKNTKIEDFLRLTQKNPQVPNVVSLCADDFGIKLGHFGSEIRKQTLSQAIQLTKGTPDMGLDPNSDNYEGSEGIWVTYGVAEHTLDRQRLPMETRRGTIGYKYDRRTNSILLNPEFEFAQEPGAYLRIEYVPIHAANMRRGMVRPWTVEQ